MVNRQISETDKTLWKPNSRSVVCSIHFKDGRPTDSNPLPTMHLGYSDTQLSESTTAKPRTPKQRYVVDAKPQNITESAPMLIKSDLTQTPDGDSNQTEHISEEPRPHTPPSTNADPSYSDIVVRSKKIKTEPTAMHSTNREQDTTLEDFRKKYQNLQGKYMVKCMSLKAKTHQLEKLKLSVNQQLLKSDSDVNFYTGLPNKETFELVARYVNAAQPKKVPTTLTVTTLKYKLPCKAERKCTKLSTANKILLTLMKIRLGLLHKDLADRYVDRP